MNGTPTQLDSPHIELRGANGTQKEHMDIAPSVCKKAAQILPISRRVEGTGPLLFCPYLKDPNCPGCSIFHPKTSQIISHLSCLFSNKLTKSACSKKKNIPESVCPKAIMLQPT